MEPTPFSYPPLRLAISTPQALQQHEPIAGYPDRAPLRTVLGASGFATTPEGRGTIMSALRGSTATFYTGAGFRFRHATSDIDILALVKQVGARGDARYRFYTIRSLPPLPRDMDILCFTPARIAREQSDPRRIFITTKFVQPGIPIFNDGIYDQYKMQAMAVLILRGAIRRAVERITPSGAARLVLEEDLFAEPWRWLSLRTYYVDAPSAALQRSRLTHFAHLALQRLQAHGQARDLSRAYAAPAEPVYGLTLPSWRYGPWLLERERTLLGFVYDQLSILLHSGGKSFAPDKAVSFLLKAISLAQNPSLRFDADLVFAG